MRALLAWTLDRQGYEVIECANGYELTARLVEYEENTDGDRIQLIISDVRMPGVDGIRAIRSVRGPLPPVILITAFGNPALHRQAQELGIAVVLNKPFDMAELLARVAQLLARSPPELS